MTVTIIELAAAAGTDAAAVGVDDGAGAGGVVLVEDSELAVDDDAFLLDRSW